MVRWLAVLFSGLIVIIIQRLGLVDAALIQWPPKCRGMKKHLDTSINWTLGLVIGELSYEERKENTKEENLNR